MIRRALALTLTLAAFGAPALAVAADGPCKKELTAVPTFTLEQILSTSLVQLTDRQKTIHAQAFTYLQTHDPRDAAKLIVLGVDAADVRSAMIPLVDADLRGLEAETPVTRLAPAAPGHAVDHGPGLEAFAKTYDLDDARRSVGAMADGYGKGAVVNVVSAAYLTEDPGLVRRAIAQGLRHGLFNELTAAAASAGHDHALLELARISLARYLFFQRNSNWLADALRALTEVTGPDRVYATRLLYDLHDLLRSPAILANESLVRTFGHAGRLSAYHGDAAQVLIATQPFVHRLRGDSTARLLYVREATEDPRFVTRFANLLNRLMDDQASLAPLAPAVALIKDRGALLKYARMAEAYSTDVPEGADAFATQRFVFGAMNLAATAYAMSGDADQILSYVQRLVDDLRFGAGAHPFGPGGPEQILMVPAATLVLYRGLARAPKTISPAVTARELEALVSWLESYDYYARQSAAAPQSVVLTRAYVAPIERTLQIFRSRGDRDHAALVEAGHENLAKGDTWTAFGHFTGARDVDGLERTYLAMMAKGDFQPAVEAALALEWTRGGRSPFDDLPK